MTKAVRYRSIWVSDTHLGTPGCQTRALLDFLDRHECEFCTSYHRWVAVSGDVGYEMLLVLNRWSPSVATCPRTLGVSTARNHVSRRRS